MAEQAGLSNINLGYSIDFDINEKHTSAYNYSRVNPIQGTTDLQLTNTQTQEVTFEIPSVVYNPYLTFLEFSVRANVATAQRLYRHNNMVPISQISVGDRSTQQIMNLSTNLHRYQKLSSLDILREDYLSNGKEQCVYRSNGLVATNQTAVGLACETNYEEMKYAESSVGTADSAGELKYRVRLSDIMMGSWFSVNKSVLLGTITVIRLVFGPGNPFFWEATNINDPATGATALTQALDVKNLRMYYGVESNPEIKALLKRKISSPEGMNYMIPVPSVFSVSRTTPEQVQQQLFITSSNGRVLQKIRNGLFKQASAIANTSVDHDNRVELWSKYESRINDQRLQEFDIESAKQHDYTTQKDKLKGSCILNPEVLATNSFLDEDFTNQDNWAQSKNSAMVDSNQVCGRAVGNGIKYEPLFTTDNSNSYDLVTVVVAQKRLNVRFNGFSIN